MKATETKNDRIAIAEQRKSNAVNLLDDAYRILAEAQNQITMVEGEGSAKIYDQIADAYQLVAGLRDRAQRMKATGLFE